MKIKNLMVLGTTYPQVPDIMRSARALGYRVISCVYQPDRQTEALADVTYVMDLYDVAALTDVARREGVSGVIAIGDTLLRSANCIARELGLRGNEISGIDKLLSKRDFRNLQHAVGLYAPENCSSDNLNDLTDMLREGTVTFPVVIKPELSSGSRGTTFIKFFDEDAIARAFNECRTYSRSGVVCAESFVENRTPGCILEIDVFVLGSDILWDGMRCCHHDSEKSFLSLGDTYDVVLSEDDLCKVKSAVSKVLSESGFTFGEANVESYFTPEGEYFIIEINPRPAGCYNPQNILQHCGVDLIKLLVSTAVGDMSYWEELKGFQRLNRHTASYTVTSSIPGIYDGLYRSREIAPHVVTVRERATRGEKIQTTQNAFDNIAYVLLDFDSQEQMQDFMGSIQNHLYPILKTEKSNNS